MKKIFLLATSALLLLAGCAKESGIEGNGAGDTVTFTVTTEDATATKAVQDGDGAAANINHWVMEVRDNDGNVYSRKEEDATTGATTHNFTVKLVKGQTYQALFWADTKGTYDIKDLTDVKLLSAESAGYAANKDSRDAFSAADASFTFDGVSSQRNVTLKRPFGQLNIIFTDLKALYEDMYSEAEYLKYRPCSLKVTAKVPTSFNVQTQTAGDPATTALNITAASDYMGNYTTHRAEETIFMDYFFATAGTKDVVDLGFNFVSNGQTIAHSFNSVPFQRNYRTNIKGELMTAGATWNVTVDPTWETPDFDVPYLVTSSIATAQSYIAPESAGTQEAKIVKVSDGAVLPTDVKAEKVENLKVVEFILKTTSPKEVSFDLPAVGENADAWYVTYETGYPTENVAITAPQGTKVIINAPNSHVKVTGTSYAQIIASTDENTLEIPAGCTVDKLVVKEGGLEIHGTVNSVEINLTQGKNVYVRACEGLSESVYSVLKDYIAKGYYGVQDGDRWNIVLEDYWPNFAAKSFSQINESSKTLNIVSPAELALFAKKLNEGGSFAGYTVTLTGTLDMSAHFWTPISAYNCGNLSGATIQGPASINGLKIKTAVDMAANPETRYNYYSGFIGQVAGALTIKNLSFNNADVTVYNGSGVAVVIGQTYSGLTLENVTVNNSTVWTCTKSGALLGFTGGDGITPVIKDCSVTNSTVKACYSYALMLGLVNAKDKVKFEGTNDVTGSNAVHNAEKTAGGDYSEFKTIKGYTYGVSGTNLWVTDVQNALAEERADPTPSKEIGGVTYGVKGSVFYYNDRVVDVMAAPQPGTVSVTSVAELTNAISDFNDESGADGAYTIEMAEGTYQMGDIKIAQKAGKQLTVKAVANADVTIGYSGNAGYVFIVNSNSSYAANAGIKFEDLKFSTGNANVLTVGAAGNRYVNDIDFINCTFTCAADQTPVTSPNNSQPSGFYFKNCTVTDGSGYLYSGYGNDKSVARDYAVKAEGCTVKNCKHFINVQNNGTVIVENCTVSVSTGDYAVRTNAGNITVSNSSFTSTFVSSEATPEVCGLLVVRKGNATVTVDQATTFSHSQEYIHDVQAADASTTVTIAGRESASITNNTYDFNN